MALSARMVLLFAGMALVIIGLPTAAKVLRWFAVISMILQPLATACEVMADCQELARCVHMIFREVNRMIDFFLNLISPTDQKEYALAEMRAVTNNFAQDQVIGRGVSGKVYKGELRDGRKVAVKRLEVGLRRAEDTFGMELALLQPLSHEHVVRLVGWCAEGEHRILVYEHMDNGTLRGHLNNAVSPSWITRIQVLLGAARAIEYLHCEAVIHSNVTSSNILLDRSLTPRVSGFGAAVRRAPGVSSQAVDVVQTSEGYRDPEYERTRQLRPAADVYSLGVVMLEVLTGQPPVRATGATLVSWALPSIQARDQLGDVLDRRHTSNPTLGQLKALKLVAKTAASCLCRDGDNRRRPISISHVVTQLEEALKLVCNE